ncbi:hypothetical protein BJ878DRAFT_51726 [Calycina marina]|uniref:Complex 1 LYR protein domain-containing protein n=1 Tax=Calycina marina TaxID=1763456 RepID=A0A9P7Z3V7_9HELO|nr:hypothetical protein BJ878DRAFT_51726 [Calycina marina]
MGNPRRSIPLSQQKIARRSIRDSGSHQTACFALYRAILRQCPRVPLDADIPQKGSVNELVWEVRKGFRRNTAHTSASLIREALTVGYNTYKLISAAANGVSVATSQINGLLRLQDQKRVISRAQPSSIQRERPRVWPYEGAKKMEDVRPRPQSELGGTGRRKIPIAQWASNGGIPFLRFSKPQSPYLSRIMRNGVEREQKRQSTNKHTKELNDLALRESHWDAQTEGRDNAPSWSYWMDAITKESNLRKHQIIVRNEQRANRLMEILDKERQLAAEEKKERKRWKKMPATDEGSSATKDVAASKHSSNTGLAENMESTRLQKMAVADIEAAASKAAASSEQSSNADCVSSSEVITIFAADNDTLSRPLIRYHSNHYKRP